MDTYETVRKEFANYNPEILKKKEIIILTKTDLIDKKEVDKKVKLMQKLKKIVVPISIIDDESLKNLRKVFEEQIKL